jgi:type I restriction enzyme S subunit
MNKEMMQDSGIEWIGAIPQGWRLDRLKDIANINENSLDAKTPDEYLLKYIEISNVNNRGIISEQAIEEIEFSAAPSRAKRKIFSGDTIISSVRPNLQAIAYIESNEVNLVCSTGFNVVQPKSRHLLESKFIYYVLLAENSKQYFESVAKGVSYPAIDDKDFIATYSALPSLAEQQAIARYLDQQCGKLDAIIAIKQQQIKTLDALRQSIIYHAVTKGLDDSVPLVDSGIEWLGKIPQSWKVERIGNISLKIGSGVTPKGGATVYLESGIPLLRSQNIHFSGLKIDEVVFIAEETHQEMKGSQVQVNDVLLNITGASLGRCFYFSDNCVFKEVNVNQHVYIIRPNHQILTKFLYYFCSSDIGQSQIFSGFRGASREGLNFKEIKLFKLGLPSIAEQQQIIDYLDQEIQRLNALTANLNQQIGFLEAYKKSLIYECVTGKKTSQNR